MPENQLTDYEEDIEKLDKAVNKFAKKFWYYHPDEIGTRLER